MGISAILAALGLAAAAQDAQLTTRADRPDTIKIHLSGHAFLDAVWRSNDVTALTEGFTGGATSDGENWVQGEVMVRVDAELSDRISVVVEMGKRQVERLGPFGLISDFSGGTGELVRLNQAQLLVREFLRPEIQAQLGISTWTFDVRGQGRSFAFDPRHSQQASRGLSRTEDTITAWGLRPGLGPNELDPVGMTLTWSKDALTVDLVALPLVIEGGTASEDEALYALDAWYRLDGLGRGSRLGFIVALMNLGPFLPGVSDDETSIVTIGGGFDLHGLAEGLEIYGEGYAQFGKAGRVVGLGFDEGLRAKGRAGQLGVEFRLRDENQTWFGANVTFVSGDDDEDLDDAGVGTFIGYENVRDLLILEDMYFGFDVDRNYLAFKIQAGLSFSAGQGRNNVEVAALAAFCRTHEEVLLLNGQGEDRLGTEVDLRLTFHVNSQMDVRLYLAWLAGSDLLEEAMGGDGVDEARESGGLASLGVDLRF